MILVYPWEINFSNLRSVASRVLCLRRLVTLLSNTSVCQTVFIIWWQVGWPGYFAVNTVEVTVFLVSLKAGGVALNLTEASRVYLMDSWWNPAVRMHYICCPPAAHDCPLRSNIVRSQICVQSSFWKTDAFHRGYGPYPSSGSTKACTSDKARRGRQYRKSNRSGKFDVTFPCTRPLVNRLV